MKNHDSIKHCVRILGIMFESYSKLQDNIVCSVCVHLINASPLFHLFLYWFEKKKSSVLRKWTLILVFSAVDKTRYVPEKKT